MKAEIISVGTELLLGDILNSNTQYLAKELAQLGISVFYQSVVGDNKERMLGTFKTAWERSDIVITTGGLGPTSDDITKETAAEFLEMNQVIHQESMDKITSFFDKQGLKMSENNIKQAYIPENSTVIPNPVGTAPGCIAEKNGKYFILLPGPPMELYPMFQNTVAPFLSKLSDCILYSKTLRLSGIGESSAASMVEDILKEQVNPTVAPYVKTFEVTLRVTAKAENTEEAKVIMQPTLDKLYSVLGEYIYGEDEDTLEGTIIEMLAKENMSIACAESCTGGLLSARLVNYPGASQVLKESVVTYSNESKMKRLGVKAETLDKFGAVSKETALEMAEGIAKTSDSHIGVSITGVAGPGGGTPEKPVGLVYIGIYINGEKHCKECNFLGDRDKIRNRTVVTALDFLRRTLKGIPNNK